jgi:segregation and condensation protein A
MTDAHSYEVNLEIFRGPLDLLLHLIRKNEVDIFDIPIAIITDQYLEYLDMMEALNMAVAADFLVMASTLLHIKSRMLIPGHDEDEEDPREELTRPLLEYLQLKEAAGDLAERELLGRDVFTRQFSSEYKEQFRIDEPLLNVDLFQLMDAFKRILETRIPGSKLTYDAEKWSVKDKSSYILEMLKEEGQLFFSELFRTDTVLGEFIATFLALLELAQLGLVRIFQPDQDKDIKLEGVFTEEEVVSHG